MQMTLRALAGLLALSLLLPWRPVAAEHPQGVNVTRWARGEIAARSDNGTVLGTETWDLTVHPDGSRTMTASSVANGVLHTAALRVDETLRPRELFAEYFANGVFRNSSFVAVRGPLLDVTSRYDQATVHTVVNMPQRFAFLAHTLATDTWVVAGYDKARDSPQPILTYGLDTEMKQPLAFGASGERSIAYVGLEPVSVPAGTFTCDHFRIGTDLDLYVFGPDLTLARALSSVTKTEYVLMRLERSGDGAAP